MFLLKVCVFRRGRSKIIDGINYKMADYVNIRAGLAEYYDKFVLIFGNFKISGNQERKCNIIKINNAKDWKLRALEQG